MASRREKGKIARAEWPAIAARYDNGETLASIARCYGCTAPAIRYIVNRWERVSPSPSLHPANGTMPAAPIERTLGPVIDRVLRERVNSDIAAFLVAFDVAFRSDSVGNRQALLDATDRLLRAGASTRIALEQLAADRRPPAKRGQARRGTATEPSRRN